ncbi:cornifelin homolog B-like [Anguilla rostrata]|nr:cornifelin homolog B-like [Anguilla anguilla]XP_035288343.1 cornifelin homolog B-like [Anguilla anguilla]
MTTTLVIQQPKPVTDAMESSQWSTGICQCWEDMSTCCFVFWCCPCFACKTSREHGQCLCLPLLDFCGIVPPITYAMRVSVRQRYGITDSMCHDCLYATCCRACSWCQISREMKKRYQPIVLINAKSKQ